MVLTTVDATLDKIERAQSSVTHSRLSLADLRDETLHPTRDKWVCLPPLSSPGAPRERNTEQLRSLSVEDIYRLSDKTSHISDFASRKNGTPSPGLCRILLPATPPHPHMGHGHARPRISGNHALACGITLRDDARGVRASHGVLGRLGELLLLRRRRQGRALGSLLRSGGTPIYRLD